uniref:Uncharacterized protein n=1 Tax=Anguilla anguilla TaxID=7936 RepID=A0A0E9WR77_ANGAN
MHVGIKIKNVELLISATVCGWGAHATICPWP